MKRIFMLITIFITLSCLSGCSTRDKQEFYGVYIFDKVSYLSPLSSNTADYINKRFKGSKYTIRKDLFKIEAPDFNFQVESPVYMKEEVPVSNNALSNVRSFIGNKVKYQYTIYDNNGVTTHWRLYFSSDCVWIALYQDNTADGSEIIMYIYKLLD